MKLCNKIRRILPLLFLVVLLLQVVLADTYSGSTNYNVDWDSSQMTGTIEFWVYDDRNQFESEWAWAGFSAPGDGDYIYAYGVVQDGASQSDVSYFSILGLDEQNTSGFGALDPNNGGIQPSSYGFTQDDGYWDWSQPDYGYIEPNQYSWLLVYSSDNDWVAGDYEIRGTENDFPVPGVPEPATVALLGVGGAYLLKRKRKS